MEHKEYNEKRKRQDAIHPRTQKMSTRLLREKTKKPCGPPVQRSQPAVRPRRARDFGPILRGLGVNRLS